MTSHTVRCHSAQAMEVKRSLQAAIGKLLGGMHSDKKDRQRNVRFLNTYINVAVMVLHRG